MIVLESLNYEYLKALEFFLNIHFNNDIDLIKIVIAPFKI